MNTITVPHVKGAHHVASMSKSEKWNQQMTYAIAFDLDTENLRNTYPTDSWKNAYADIRNHLLAHGFKWQQGSVCFGGETVDAVQCVIVVQELARMYTWFESSVRDIRMLRIEENNDLMPAIISLGH